MNRIPVTLEIAAVTDIGQKRSSNQDNFFVNNCYIDHEDILAERFDAVDSMAAHVLAVCDGMGGQADGDIAALIGVSTVSEYAARFDDADSPEETSRLAKKLIRDANSRVLERSESSGKKMGSTISMLVVTSKFVYACNVGDSEIYHKHRYGIERLSKPHTVAQELVDVGAISEYQASRSYRRNQLSQYLGMENPRILKQNEAFTTVRSGDMLLICSDGISDVLPDHSIYASLSSSRPVSDIADAIIEKALRKGSGDNLTVVIARVLDDGHMAMLKRRLAMLLGAVVGIAAFAAILLSLL
ncbi:MAG: PP2C family protein-serine/threonine phosphatase [Acutalibacteraceae bacterium]|nr:protein phosphatase 2C domain-containing protein [Bacillota bacterium]